MGNNPLWDFTPQGDLPYPYHEHPTMPRICGHWHKQNAEGTVQPQKLIPVVRAYRTASYADSEWVGFLVWYTGSIYDDPIMVARDNTDVRNWGMNDTWMARDIYNALHGGGWATGLGEVIILTKQHSRFWVDGLSAQNEEPILTCANMKTGSPGFTVEEDHGITEWNASSYSASWPGSYNHEFNGFEFHLDYPDNPRIFTGPFYYAWSNSFADSGNLQTVAYNWKPIDDPCWDILPEPDNYGPMVNDYEYGYNEVDNYYDDTYIIAYHLTPLGYDNTELSTYCAKVHQLWGWELLQ